ncbi:MAG TPA: hypothetical protein VFN61_14170 [Acidimicrobiales bacterium]|nr:hypothetical protein [Acidimicrobiales bacterium]
MSQRTCRLEDEGGAGIAVEIVLGDADSEGWMGCEVHLVKDGVDVAACKSDLRQVDLANLVDGLRSTMDEAQRRRLRWAPAEPSFLAWAEAFNSGAIEVIFMVDSGLADGGASTDSGVAVVVTVAPDALVTFCRELAG